VNRDEKTTGKKCPDVASPAVFLKTTGGGQNISSVKSRVQRSRIRIAGNFDAALKQ
jgi:hypothetical protein